MLLHIGNTGLKLGIGWIPEYTSGVVPKGKQMVGIPIRCSPGSRNTYIHELQDGSPFFLVLWDPSRDPTVKAQFDFTDTKILEKVQLKVKLNEANEDRQGQRVYNSECRVDPIHIIGKAKYTRPRRLQRHTLLPLEAINGSIQITITHPSTKEVLLDIELAKSTQHRHTYMLESSDQREWTYSMLLEAFPKETVKRRPSPTPSSSSSVASHLDEIEEWRKSIQSPPRSRRDSEASPRPTIALGSEETTDDDPRATPITGNDSATEDPLTEMRRLAQARQAMFNETLKREREEHEKIASEYAQKRNELDEGYKAECETLLNPFINLQESEKGAQQLLEHINQSLAPRPSTSINESLNEIQGQITKLNVNVDKLWAEMKSKWAKAKSDCDQSKREADEKFLKVCEEKEDLEVIIKEKLSGVMKDLEGC